MADEAGPVQLSSATLVAFTEFVQGAEAAMPASAPFLWCKAAPDRLAEVRRGGTLAESLTGKPVHVPDGLIHDWVGATFAPNTSIPRTLAAIQDYNRHKELYRPEVVDSKLLSRNGDEFEIFLRLLKKKVISVVLDTWHHVRYFPVDAVRWRCDSYTTRISEVQDAGKPDERLLRPDSGHGFLWRLNSYWRFEEEDGGVYVECRALTLTRDIPRALKLIISPIVKKLPKESLVQTLEATRRAAV